MTLSDGSSEPKNVWSIRDVEFVKSCATQKQMLHDNVPQIAFAGRSNVGKSSLLNLLVNRKRIAQVSATPGRTRLVNYFSINKGEMYFVDLPGYGFARTSKDMQGAWRNLMNAYLYQNKMIRACCTLFDIRREGLTEEDEALIEWLYHFQVSIIAVLTKSDKLSRSQQSQAMMRLKKSLSRFEPAAIICASSQTRRGKEEILSAIDGIVTRGNNE